LLYRNGIVLTDPRDKDARIPISKARIKRFLLFRRPDDYRSMKQPSGGGGGKGALPGHVVLICLGGGKNNPVRKMIEFKGKPMTQVCFQLPSYGGSSPTEEEWRDGLVAALLAREDGAIRIRLAMEADCVAGADAFRLADEDRGTMTTGGMLFASCYRGFHNGALFPLREGLLFFRPPLFVHQ
jgi:hypothetical protein